MSQNMTQEELDKILQSTQKIVDAELSSLLRYLTRDTSWKGCFDVAIDEDGFLERLRRKKLVGHLFRIDDPEWEATLRKIIKNVVLWRGLPVKDTNVTMRLVENDSNSSSPDGVVPNE